MSGIGQFLNEDQVRVVNSVLDGEFETFIRTTDPHFTGFGAVSQWVAMRRRDLLDNHPLFETHVQEERRAYKSGIDFRFRDFYQCLR
ncbi:unnamed protein product, partial [Peniophora sp. CBMAI 1063]